MNNGGDDVRDFDIQIEHYDKNNKKINIHLPENNEQIKKIVKQTIIEILSI